MSTVATLSVRITASISDFEKQMGGLERGFARTGSKLQSLGANLTKGITLPLAALGGFAAKAAIDFESSFAGVKKTVNATDAEFAVLAQGMRDLAKEMPVNVNELNRIGEAAGQLGIPQANILEFTKVMAQLGATTNLSSDDAATSIAQIQNIFNASGKNTQQFASALVALGNAGASTEQDIVEMAKRLAGAGHQVGMSQAEVLGLSSALANLGINAEAGGTALSKVLSKMSVAADMGKAETFAKVAGMSEGGFIQLFKSDSSEALTRFVEGLGRAGASGQNLTMILNELGLKDARITDALKRMAGGADQLRIAFDLGRSSWQQNSALTEEYRKRLDTVHSQLVILWNRVMDVAVTFGTAMLPTIKALVEASDPFIKNLALMADGFSKLPMPAQAMILALGGMAAAAGPVIFVAGTLIESWGAIAGVLKLGAGTLASVGTAAGTAAGGVGLMATAFGALTAAVSAFSAGWVVGMAADTFTIGGLRPSEWVEFLASWKFGLAGVSAENAKLAITSRQLSDELARMRGPNPRTSDIALASDTPGHSKVLAGFAGGESDGAKAAKKELDRLKGAEKALQDESGFGGAATYIRTVDAKVAVDRAWRQEQNDLGLQQLKAEVDRLDQQATAHRQMLNQLGEAEIAHFGAREEAAVAYLAKELALYDAEQAQIRQLRNEIGERMMEDDAARLKGVRGDVFALADAFGRLGQAAGGAFGQVSSWTGALINSIGHFGTNMTALTDGFGALSGGKLLSGLTSLVGGIGGIANMATLATQGIKALFNAFSGGEEAKVVNPARDQFMSQFGDPSNKGVGGAGHNLAGLIQRFTGSQDLFHALQSADTKAEFDAAKGAIGDLFRKKGRPIKLGTGGIVMSPTHAMLGERGPEAVIPLDGVARFAMPGGRRPGGNSGHITVNVTAPYASQSEWIRKEVTAAVLEAINSGGKNFGTFRSLVQQAV